MSAVFSIQAKLAVAAWASLLVVLYATLMPFEFGNQSVAQAWSHFTSMTVPQMSASVRQQWVANIVMFVPLGLFWTAWLSGYARGVVARFWVGVFVALLALATTATVEFLQFWLPRREPSLLDMSGNLMGGVLGVFAWYALSGPVLRGVATLRQGGDVALWWALVLYAGAYALAAWLPWDFIVSLGEVAGKLATDHWGLWRSPASSGAGGEWWILRGVAMVMTAPLGILLGWWLLMRLPGLTGFGAFSLVLVASLAFGLLIELGQFLTVSGVAEGGSGLFRALGVVVGFGLFAARKCFNPDRLRSWARALVVMLLVPFISLLVVINLGGEGFALETRSVLAKWESVRFLPFWYHYMVPEAVAIGSLIFHVIMYLPVGVGVWLWGWGHRRNTPQRGLWSAVVLAWVLAVGMEGGKLFMAGLRPDPTTVWIAAAAAWLGWQLCAALWWGLQGGMEQARVSWEGPARSLERGEVPRHASFKRASKYPGIEPADSGFVRDKGITKPATHVGQD
ncbi:VanZ like family protein [Ectothiorhodospira marina]|uniref:VanZ like family protein n=1 Tax=Ectothiorhodospira marina TaxID=1396821 RepID=A0A1H7IBJ9_9GAMM|nr:VanZ like family protein [Ectothiorhodospira marina]